MITKEIDYVFRDRTHVLSVAVPEEAMVCAATEEPNITSVMLAWNDTVISLNMSKETLKELYDTVVLMYEDKGENIAPIILYRAADRVHHKPTNENWCVAAVEGEHVYWCGYPFGGYGELKDCTLIRRAT